MELVKVRVSVAWTLFSAGLWMGGDKGPGTVSSQITAQCHDITVFPELGLAAGACAGNGILFDVKDPDKSARSFPVNSLAV